MTLSRRAIHPARNRSRQRCRRVPRPAARRAQRRTALRHRGAVVSIPKRDPANSFILHAPLELLARRALLHYVAPDRRDAVREQIVRVAALYERAAEPIEARNDASFASPAAAGAALAGAVAAKDLDAVDAAAAWLGRCATADDVLALADTTVASLAAAGHANIYFLLLARTACVEPRRAHVAPPAGARDRPLPRVPGRVARRRFGARYRPSRHRPRSSPARWPARRCSVCPAATSCSRPCTRSIRAGRPAPSSNRTSPPTSPVASRAIQRTAAQSMLQDDPTFAPYGWTHCLTLSQAALGIRHRLADPVHAAAIAATYVVAFRAAEGAHVIDADFEPDRPGVARGRGARRRARRRCRRSVPRIRRGARRGRARARGARRQPRRRARSRSTRWRASTPPHPTRRRGASIWPPRPTSARGGRRCADPTGGSCPRSCPTPRCCPRRRPTLVPERADPGAAMATTRTGRKRPHPARAAPVDGGRRQRRGDGRAHRRHGRRAHGRIGGGETRRLHRPRRRPRPPASGTGGDTTSAANRVASGARGRGQHVEPSRDGDPCQLSVASARWAATRTSSSSGPRISPTGPSSASPTSSGDGAGSTSAAR